MAFGAPFGRVMRPSYGPNLAPAAGGNGLLNNLIAYWSLNEAAGANNALDMHSNGLTLTQSGDPGAGTGKVYATARIFAGSQKFTRTSEALLLTGDVDFTVAAWLYLAATSSEMAAIGKYTSTGNQREHVLEFNSSANRFRWIVSANGTATVSVDASTFGAPSATTWYLVTVQHDSVNNTIGIGVNGGAMNTTAHSTGIFSGSSVWQISGINNSGTIAWSGRIGPAMFWKRKLSSTDIAALFNSGSGLAYAAFTT